jgi:hypothetical protein
MSRRRRRGNTLLEFTLVGIPMIFVIISTFELARGMWLYHTLAYAIKSGTRYSIVHGQNCTLGSNTCAVSIRDIAGVIQSAGTGLPSDSLALTFTPANGSATTCTLSTCIASYTNMWPPAGANAVGLKVKISAVMPFQSMIVMFWPGAGKPINDTGTLNLTADSSESILY